MKKKYYYNCADYEKYLNTNFDNAYSINTKETNLFYVVQECAENHFWYHDGLENPYKWPLIFILWDDEGNQLGIFEVNMEAIPEFYATKI